jgi:hypothetical protein
MVPSLFSLKADTKIEAPKQSVVINPKILKPSLETISPIEMRAASAFAPTVHQLSPVSNEEIVISDNYQATREKLTDRRLTEMKMATATEHGVKPIEADEVCYLLL